MKKFYPYLAVGLSFLCVTVASAQDATPAPKYIQIYREFVKPGKGPAHQKTEGAFARDMKSSNAMPNYTAMVSITGPNEAWFVSRYDSVGAWGKDTEDTAKNTALQASLDRDNTVDGELLTDSRSIIARFRDDLSHRPGVSVPLTRFFSISIVRIRPGHVPDFEAARKIIKDAHDKAAPTFNYSVYQVTSGMPAGTFLIISYYKTLADVDAAAVIHGKEYTDAIGDDGQRKLNELASSGTISSDPYIFAVDPKMSYPDKATIAADPAFWAPKSSAAPAPTTKKPGSAKPSGK